MTGKLIALGLAGAVTALCAGAAATAEYDPARVDAARAAFVERMIAQHGFERESITAALDGAVILDGVLEAISRPAERVVPWYEYREIFLNDARIEAGVEFWRTHAGLIAATAAEHGVDPEVLLAIVGVETLFGQRMGSYRVLDALSTLAFAYPPRAAFFRSELEAFLLLWREEGEALLDVKGSYAGAMGAGQFIPSSFSAYAVDANGDGRRDLWGDWADVLGSVANYLKAHGWRAGEPVAVPATRPAEASVPEPDNGLDLDATVGSLRALGYEFPASMPASRRATVMALERDADSFEYWIGFHNFHVITRYNRSIKYALAVHQLSDAIRSAYRRSQTATVTP